MVAVSACIAGDKTNHTLPKSLGSNHEIVVVVDSGLWKSPAGAALRAVFDQTLITPQAEPLFKLLNIRPTELNHIFKRHHSLIFMTALDQQNQANRTLQNWFSSQDLKTIQSDSQFIFQRHDLYAKAQTGLFLAAKNPKQLAQAILQSKPKLQVLFNQRELKRWQTALYNHQEQIVLAQELRQRHNYKVRIPNTYQLVKDEKKRDQGFTWLRLTDVDYDKHLVIAYKPYTNTQETNQDAIIAWRNRLSKTHLFGDPANPESFILTESLEPPKFQHLKFRKHYAVLVRGLWRTNNYNAGGPFVSYFIVDEHQSRLYYVEGFIWAPGRKKRNFLRELEAIMLSFEI